MTALSGVLAVRAGRGAATASVVLAVLAGQLFVGWTNDYLDADLDRRQGRADKPVAAGSVSRREVRVASLVALVLTLPLSLASGIPAAAVHLTAIAAATLYNVRLKGTPLSVLPYAAAFALPPAFITMGLPGHPWPAWWLVVAAGLVGAGGHFTQSLPDIAADRAAGLRGLPNVLGPRWSAVAAAALLFLAMMVVAGAADNRSLLLIPLGLGGAICILIVALAFRGRERLAFRFTLAAAALAVAGVVLEGGGLVSR